MPREHMGAKAAEPEACLFELGRAVPRPEGETRVSVHAVPDEPVWQRP